MLLQLASDDPRKMPLFAAIFGEEPAAGRLAAARAWGVVEGGRLLAATTVEEDATLPGGWYVWLFGVHPESRRRGFGRALLAGIEQQARAAGVTRLRVRTFAHYAGMRGLLAKSGWWFAAATPDNRHDGVAETWLKPLIPTPIPVVLVGANPTGRGGEWAAAIGRMPDLLRVVAAVDVGETVREHWRRAGIATATRIEDLPPDMAVEAAILALPPRNYAAVRQGCLKRGWGMLHEKPLGADLAELAAFQQELQRHPVPLVAGVQRRNHPSYVALKQLIRGANLRTLSLVLHLARPPDETPAGHRADMALTGGGCLLDLGYHGIDLVHFLLDAPLEPVAVTLSTRGQPTRRGEREDRALVLGRSGATWVRLELASAAAKPVEMLDMVAADGCRWTADRERVQRNGSEVYTCPRSWADAECGRLAALAAAIRSQPAPPDLWEHLAALAVIERAYGLAPAEGLGTRHD